MLPAGFREGCRSGVRVTVNSCRVRGRYRSTQAGARGRGRLSCRPGAHLHRVAARERVWRRRGDAGWSLPMEAVRVLAPSWRTHGFDVVDPQAARTDPRLSVREIRKAGARRRRAVTTMSWSATFAMLSSSATPSKGSRRANAGFTWKERLGHSLPSRSTGAGPNCYFRLRISRESAPVAFPAAVLSWAGSGR